MKECDDIVLRATGVSKSFPGVRALDDVSMTLRRGRLTALLGENGAGKSTLMNIIVGVFPPDAGTIQLNGKEVRFHNPRDAYHSGISMIFQELNLVSQLTVAENIFLGREPLNRVGLIDYDRMNAMAKELLDQLDLSVCPTEPLARLRVGQQQIIEIAKALSTNASVIIMDEPTSAITTHEIDVLYGVIDALKKRGVAIAYITHKLEELTRVGDDAVVMRDGQLVGQGDLADLSHNEIVQMMVGRDVDDMYQSRARSPDKEVLRVENVTLPHPEKANAHLLKNVSFEVREGEVLGIFGLMGAGRTELLEVVFGLHPDTAQGDCFIGSNQVSIQSPADAIRLGIALAPEDRKQEGLMLEMSVAENASLACLPSIEKFGLLNSRMERDLVADTISTFNVKTPSQKQAIRNLSGGNQQKVILGKWLATKPRVLLLDEPTRGIDINAKSEIYSLIDELAKDGLALVVVSSELPEILALSDRVMVLCEGVKTAEFSRREATEESIMNAALSKST